MKNKRIIEKVELLHNTLRAYCTNDNIQTGDYQSLRQELMSNSLIEPLLPDFVRKYRKLEYFWDFIKDKYKHYNERRVFLNDEFSSIYEFLESQNIPSDENITNILEKYSVQAVYDLWVIALSRRDNDPEGAITASKSLLEAACKDLIIKLNNTYGEHDNLPKLYRTLSKTMKLAPSQHTEKQFKQILGGITTIINGLSSIRNLLSDSHGSVKLEYKPSPRHAHICVNLAGVISVFLYETYNDRFI